MRPIDTPRLLLRPWRPADERDMFAYSTDPLVGPSAGWPCHRTLDESREVIARFIASDEVLALELRGAGRVIGSIGLHPRHPDDRLHGEPQRELGYVLARPFWGMGLMTEAARAVIAQGFSELGLALITCGHYEGNLRSRRVMEKCGFTYAFPKRVTRDLLDGSEATEHIFRLTREEYDAQRAAVLCAAGG